MANYRWSICEPDQPTVIEKGLILKEDLMAAFENFPWMGYLRQMEGMKESDIHYSPSLEFENLDTKQDVVFSIAGNEVNNEFYVFYKRPKTIKTFFGLSKKEVDGYMTDITGQTKEDALHILTAFLNNDTDYLGEK
jgi:hypothetical protein